MKTTYFVSSFVGEQAEGNAHCVIISDHIDIEKGLALSVQLSPLIVVVISLQNHRVAPRFYHHGREVARCGSGSVATAYVLQKYRGIKLPVDLDCKVGKIHAGEENGAFGKMLLFYQTDILSIQKSPDNRTWQHILDRPIVSLSLVGNDGDYVIAELGSEKAVKACKVSHQNLCRLSRRALIVTAPSAKTNWDYVMRYFAPQYGNPEDPATGSANAMLAVFWQHKTGKQIVRGRQVSSAGGEFIVRKVGHQQRVCGRVMEVPVPDAMVSTLNT